MSRFTALNNKLQSLLDEQSDLELLLNPLINWEEQDESYKNWLDFKYAGREFDISRKWKDKVSDDNEIKRKIFLKLSIRKEELGRIIEKVIEELNPSIDYDQVEEIFK